jgi:hypothetical protein
VVPIVLGEGIRLFASPAARRVPLEPVELDRSGQLINLRFRVAA